MEQLGNSALTPPAAKFTPPASVSNPLPPPGVNAWLDHPYTPRIKSLTDQMNSMVENEGKVPIDQSVYSALRDQRSQLSLQRTNDILGPPKTY